MISNDRAQVLALWLATIAACVSLMLALACVAAHAETPAGPDWQKYVAPLQAQRDRAQQEASNLAVELRVTQQKAAEDAAALAAWWKEYIGTAPAEAK